MTIIETDFLDLNKVWPSFDTDIFRANKIISFDHYYPVYQWKDYYSYSPYKLLRLKGNFVPDPDFDQYLEKGQMVYYPPVHAFIDAEITKLGGPIQQVKPVVKEEDEFACEMAKALVSDIKILEERHPEATFCILTGGKDSLNLLLLPWKNPVVAFSAEPNYPLVAAFCEENGLNIPLEKLGDEGSDTPAMLERDILFGCCRVGLADMRWNQSLANIKATSRYRGKEIVLIVGALADAFTTGYHLKWKCRWQKVPWYKKGKWQNYFPENYYKTAWLRGAQWQGVCQGLMRESTDILNYSAYQGPGITGLLAKTDLRKAVTRYMAYAGAYFEDIC